MEEVAGVETDSPTTNLEVDSPNQQPRLQADGLENNPSRKDGDQTLAENLSLEIRDDQPNATTNGYNVESGKASKSDENSSKDAIPTTKIQTTSMVMSQEEFDQLEKANPLAAFGLMLKNGALFKSIWGSSNTSTDDPLKTSRETLLAEFRSKVLEVELFQAIEQDAAIIPQIKELLCKLIKTQTPYSTKFQEFSQALEPLMEEINLSFHQKKGD